VPESIEISELDLRYESFRMKNPALERKLLGSIQQHGLQEPLSGADPGAEHILLDGFKRLRCARSLGVRAVPYVALGLDQAQAITCLLRSGQPQALGILEQARFVDELHNFCQLSLSDIAQHLSRSKGWISMRLGLCEELSEAIREKLFTAQFPAYAYLYTVRPFMRMNRVPPERIEPFVLAVSGQGLSVREIDFLFRHCFGSSQTWQEQILTGRLELPLRHYRASLKHPGMGNALEHEVLQDLEVIGKLMRRVWVADDEHLKSPAFKAQANLLSSGILTQATAFLKRLREMHARTEQT
jgi:hypothetical protein